MKHLVTLCALLVVCCAAHRRADTCSGTDLLLQGFSPPLVAAAGGGDVGEVKRLLLAGADPNGQDCDDIASESGGPVTKHLGFTPLMLAVGHGHLEVADILIRAGADPNRATSDGRTAMDFAVESGRPEALAFMKRQSHR